MSLLFDLVYIDRSLFILFLFILFSSVQFILFNKKEKTNEATGNESNQEKSKEQSPYEQKYKEYLDQIKNEKEKTTDHYRRLYEKIRVKLATNYYKPKEDSLKQLLKNRFFNYSKKRVLISKRYKLKPRVYRGINYVNNFFYYPEYPISYWLKIANKEEVYIPRKIKKGGRIAKFKWHRKKQLERQLEKPVTQSTFLKLIKKYPRFSFEHRKHSYETISIYDFLRERLFGHKTYYNKYLAIQFCRNIAIATYYRIFKTKTTFPSKNPVSHSSWVYGWSRFIQQLVTPPFSYYNYYKSITALYPFMPGSSKYKVIESNWVRKYIYKKPWIHQVINTITKNRISIYDKKKPIQYIKAKKHYNRRLKLKKSHLVLKTDRLTKYVYLNYYLFRNLNYNRLFQSVLYNYTKYPIYRGSVKHLNKDFISFLRMVKLHSKRGILRKKKLFRKKRRSFKVDSTLLYLLRWVVKRHLKKPISKHKIKNWAKKNRDRIAYYYRFKSIIGQLKLDLRMSSLALLSPKLFEHMYKEDMVQLKKYRGKFISYLLRDSYGLQKIGSTYFPYLIGSVQETHMKINDFTRQVKKRLKKYKRRKNETKRNFKLNKKNIFYLRKNSIDLIRYNRQNYINSLFKAILVSKLRDFAQSSHYSSILNKTNYKSIHFKTLYGFLFKTDRYSNFKKKKGKKVTPILRAPTLDFYKKTKKKKKQKLKYRYHPYKRYLKLKILGLMPNKIKNLYDWYQLINSYKNKEKTVYLPHPLKGFYVGGLLLRRSKRKGIQRFRYSAIKKRRLAVKTANKRLFKFLSSKRRLLNRFNRTIAKPNRTRHSLLNNHYFFIKEFLQKKKKQIKMQLSPYLVQLIHPTISRLFSWPDLFLYLNLIKKIDSDPLYGLTNTKKKKKNSVIPSPSEQVNTISLLFIDLFDQAGNWLTDKLNKLIGHLSLFLLSAFYYTTIFSLITSYINRARDRLAIIDKGVTTIGFLLYAMSDVTIFFPLIGGILVRFSYFILSLIHSYLISSFVPFLYPIILAEFSLVFLFINAINRLIIVLKFLVNYVYRFFIMLLIGHSIFSYLTLHLPIFIKRVSSFIYNVDFYYYLNREYNWIKCIRPILFLIERQTLIYYYLKFSRARVAKGLKYLILYFMYKAHYLIMMPLFQILHTVGRHEFRFVYRVDFYQFNLGIARIFLKIIQLVLSNFFSYWFWKRNIDRVRKYLLIKPYDLIGVKLLLKMVLFPYLSVLRITRFLDYYRVTLSYKLIIYLTEMRFLGAYLANIAQLLYHYCWIFYNKLYHSVVLIYVIFAVGRLWIENYLTVSYPRRLIGGYLYYANSLEELSYTAWSIITVLLTVLMMIYLYYVRFPDLVCTGVRIHQMKKQVLSIVLLRDYNIELKMDRIFRDSFESFLARFWYFKVTRLRSHYYSTVFNTWNLYQAHGNQLLELIIKFRSYSPVFYKLYHDMRKYTDYKYRFYNYPRKDHVKFKTKWKHVYPFKKEWEITTDIPTDIIKFILQQMQERVYFFYVKTERTVMFKLKLNDPIRQTYLSSYKKPEYGIERTKDFISVIKNIPLKIKKLIIEPIYTRTPIYYILNFDLFFEQLGNYLWKLVNVLLHLFLKVHKAAFYILVLINLFLFHLLYPVNFCKMILLFLRKYEKELVFEKAHFFLYFLISLPFKIEEYITELIIYTYNFQKKKEFDLMTKLENRISKLPTKLIFFFSFLSRLINILRRLWLVIVHLILETGEIYERLEKWYSFGSEDQDIIDNLHKKRSIKEAGGSRFFAIFRRAHFHLIPVLVKTIYQYLFIDSSKKNQIKPLFYSLVDPYKLYLTPLIYIYQWLKKQYYYVLYGEEEGPFNSIIRETFYKENKVIRESNNLREATGHSRQTRYDYLDEDQMKKG